MMGFQKNFARVRGRDVAIPRERNYLICISIFSSRIPPLEPGNTWEIVITHLVYRRLGESRGDLRIDS